MSHFTAIFGFLAYDWLDNIGEKSMLHDNFVSKYRKKFWKIRPNCPPPPKKVFVVAIFDFIPGINSYTISLRQHQNKGTSRVESLGICHYFVIWNEFWLVWFSEKILYPSSFCNPCLRIIFCASMPMYVFANYQRLSQG